MKSILLKSFGGVENLFIGTCPKPVPKANEVLVKVKSFALNRADILQRLGRYPPPPGDSDILGLEMSGIVEECHNNDLFKKGDRVFGLVGGGAYGEYCIIQQQHLMPLPSHMTFEQGAAIPEAWLTAFQAFHLLAQVQPHHSIMIHAAASGVGTALIQLAKVSESTKIIGTCGSKEKEDFIKSLGCTHTINYKTTESFVPVVSDITDKKGVSVIFDYVGSKYWNQNMKSLEMDGTMVIQGLLSGASVKDEHGADIGSILSKRLTIKGSTLRNRTNEYKTGLIKQFESKCLELFQSGQLKPIIDKVFDYTEIQEAHKYLESNANKGKVVIKSFNF